MLANLKISNYALIKDIVIDLRPGLNVVTGETGAGKSIILGALGLLQGNRADTSAVNNPETKCYVETTFGISPALKPFFEDNELDFDLETLVRREILPSGKSRAFINDTPVTLNVLKEFSEKLFDIHSQFQTLQLGQERFQLLLLDQFAGNAALLEAYRLAFQQYRQAKKDIAAAEEQMAKARRDRDYLQYQADELEKLALQPGEMEKLEAEANVLAHAENIQVALARLYCDLDENETSVLPVLGTARKYLGSISNISEEAAELARRLESVYLEARELATDAQNMANRMTADPQRLEEMNQRLQTIALLLQKHQLKTGDELLALQAQIDETLLATGQKEEDLERLKKQLAVLEQSLEKQAKELHTVRQTALPAFLKHLEELLRNLGMPEAQVGGKLAWGEAFTSEGRSQFGLLFSANKGYAPAPVSQVASGGELSRFMLAAKSILADALQMPILVFDEIDSGISGEVARKVGHIIRQLAEGRQVLCITHQVQVASLAQHHYLVYKQINEHDSETRIRPLQQEERVLEIASMIAGQAPGPTAIQNARELMQTA